VRWAEAALYKARQKNNIDAGFTSERIVCWGILGKETEPHYAHAVWSPMHCDYQLSQRVRMQEIVGIEEQQIISRCSADPSVSCR
jgi:hypothetical protein